MTTYGTARRLDELRLALSTRDLAILGTLGRYRLATGQQLRRLHFSGHSSPEAAARAARRALRRLADVSLVDHLERRIGGVRAGSSGLVWHLNRTGWRMLAQVEGHDLPRRLDTAEPSLRTCDHRLATTEVAVRLHEATESGTCDVIALNPEPTCWRTYLNAGGGVLTLKPDLFAVTAANSAEFEDVWFIEVDRATESKATVARKAEQYEAYRRSGREQQAQGEIEPGQLGSERRDNMNSKCLPHAAWHYGGEFLRAAYAQAGDAKLRKATMDQAKKYYQQHASRLDPIVMLVDELSDGFLDLNWSYEVVPLGKYYWQDEMVERIRKDYGMTVALKIDCTGNGVYCSEWLTHEESDRDLPHAVASVVCRGFAYPMLVIGERRR